jgi:hypothetical protein
MTHVLYGNVDREYRVIERGEGLYLYDASASATGSRKSWTR